MNVLAGGAAEAGRGDAAQSGLRSRGVRVPAVLLLVRAGPGRELLLGIAGVHSRWRSARGGWESAEDAHLLAASHSRRRYDDAVLVSREDRRGNDARGSAGAADPAGRALEGPDADSSARSAEGAAGAEARSGKMPKPQIAARPAHVGAIVVRFQQRDARWRKPRRTKKEKVKADPALVAKARELRDRWLERVNAAGGASVKRRIAGVVEQVFDSVGRNTPLGRVSRPIETFIASNALLRLSSPRKAENHGRPIQKATPVVLFTAE
jgi:hypothetical protein